MFYNGLVEIALAVTRQVNACNGSRGLCALSMYKLSAELGEHLSLDIIQYEIFEHTH